MVDGGSVDGTVSELVVVAVELLLLKFCRAPAGPVITTRAGSALVVTFI